MEALTKMVSFSEKFIQNIFIRAKQSHFLSILSNLYNNMTLIDVNTTLTKELSVIFWSMAEYYNAQNLLE
ncbi:MAG: hypothetical protein ACRCTQ_02800 [Brevinemataceae bacterium]